jgi:hypothetical protein
MAKKIRMLTPVVCTHCGAIYDLCAVVPISRYADCTTFKTPCCGRLVDDRKWKSLPDIRSLERNDLCPTDSQGRVRHVRVINPDTDGSKFPAKTAQV